MSLSVCESPAMPPRISVKAAAEFAGLSTGAIYALCTAGKLKHYRLPGAHQRACVRIDSADLQRLLAESVCEPVRD